MILKLFIFVPAEKIKPMKFLGSNNYIQRKTFIFLFNQLILNLVNCKRVPALQKKKCRLGLEYLSISNL